MTVSDPITNEIIRNSFLAIAEEMNNGLVRSAFSPVIYESKDSAVAIIDAEHRVLGQSSGIPLFLGNLEHCTKVTEEMFGRDAWQDGDIWIMNDSYISGTHPHDVTVYAPLFYRGELAGFVASRAHWLDIGGKDPGVAMDSTEIQQEGLRIKPMRIVQGGAERTDVIELIVGNTRFPVSCTGDLRAQFRRGRAGPSRAGRGSTTGTAATSSRPPPRSCSPSPSSRTARASPRSRTARTRPTATSTATASPAFPYGSRSSSPWPATP